MTGKSQGDSIRNVLFAISMGALALVLALFSMLADIRRTTADREMLATFSKRPAATTASATRGPFNPPVYRLGGKGEALFGTVLRFRISGGALIAAALFYPDGELKTIRTINASRTLDEHLLSDSFQGFVGKGGSEPYSLARRNATATEELPEMGERDIAILLALDEASAAVRSAVKENQ
jgi:hypothetical protein